MFHFMNHCQLLKMAQLAPAAGGAFGSYTDCSQHLWSINLSSKVMTYYKFNHKVHPNFDATFNEK